MPPTWIIIDDINPGLHYEGLWSSRPPTPEENVIGNLGYVFGNTMHIATGNASLSYPFNGTWAGVHGTTNHRDPEPLPNITCVVDGVKQQVNDGRNTQANNFHFCDANGLSPGAHLIEFSVEVPEGKEFIFDNIDIGPVDVIGETGTDTALLGFGFDNPHIQFIGDWNMSQDGYKMTSTLGSKAVVTFTGTSFKWYTNFYPNLPLAQSSVVWVLDGGDPQSVIIQAPQNSTLDPPKKDMFLFDAGSMPAGTHRLELTYQSEANQTPLTLAFLVVQNATVPADADLPNTTTVPVATHNPSTKGAGLATGAKIGIGVASGLACISLLLLLLWSLKRWKRPQNKTVNQNRVQIIPQGFVREAYVPEGAASRTPIPQSPFNVQPVRSGKGSIITPTAPSPATDITSASSNSRTPAGHILGETFEQPPGYDESQIERY
ncbi:hypothetical protein BJ165DRAFT_1447777 [Panaeolus papilionaceus]|nr:hypothetical protein BJ165DRAFT_1447777 [Panaeolus papilionaceus]